MGKIMFLFLMVWYGLYGLTSCSRSGSYIGQFDDTVDNAGDTRYKLNKLSFTINMMDGDGDYVCLDRIDSIELKVDGQFWGVFASEGVDIKGKDKLLKNNLYYSSEKVDYLVLATYEVKSGKLETAGDYINALKNRIILTPGDYVCEVVRLKFEGINGAWIELKPQIYKNFKVVENTTSSYIGEIETIIK